MKILFLVYTGKYGNGGHLHSLNTIASEIAKGYKAEIVTIGWKKCQILKENECFINHINTQGLSVFLACYKLLKLYKKSKPDLIHCFDYVAFYYSFILDPFQKKTVVNRCGGENPVNSPYVSKLLVFSQENYDWIKIKHPKSYLQLTPNRVKSKSPDYYSVKNFLEDTDKFIFMRTCRIANRYRKSIFDSINLIENINKISNRKCQLVIIGMVQDKELLQELKELERSGNDFLKVIYSDEITRETARYLKVADAVIGVGRSAAEAASLKKPVLAIDRDGIFPVLLSDNDTWNSALKTNISERNVFSDKQRNESFELVLKMIEEDSFRKKISQLSLEYFSEVYSADRILNEYDRFYQKVTGIIRPTIKDSLIRGYRLIKLIINNMLGRQ